MTGQWYGRKWNDEPKGRVQTHGVEEYLKSGIPLDILQMAGTEYEAQNFGQSFKEVQSRGGFGVSEVIQLLADALERKTNG